MNEFSEKFQKGGVISIQTLMFMILDLWTMFNKQGFLSMKSARRIVTWFSENEGGVLELFRKFIRYGSVTRSLLSTEKVIVIYFLDVFFPSQIFTL